MQRYTILFIIVNALHVSSRTRLELIAKLSTNMYDIYHCWVYSE